MEDPSFYVARKLRPPKLGRRAYSIALAPGCSLGEQFEFSGSEGGRTPTAGPRSLTRPSDAPVYEGGCATNDVHMSQLDS
jgi:hypothetical protein